MANLTKALKCAGSDDSCTIRYSDADSDTVKFTFEDDKKGRCQDVVVKLMDIDTEQLGIPDQKYSVEIDMPSAEFSKTCRDIALFSDSLNISATKSGLEFKVIFSC